MPCNLTIGRAEACKEAIGGLKAVYFINYQIVPSDVTFTNDLITAVTNVDNLYKYELKSNENVFDQEIVTSREAGTTFFRQTLTIKLKKQDATTHKEIKLLAYSRPHVLIENNNGQFFLMGLFRGADLTAGSINNGGALGDFNGYSLTFVAEEALPAPFTDITSSTTIVADCFTGATVVTA
jgi:hypothetical protein